MSIPPLAQAPSTSLYNAVPHRFLKSLEQLRIMAEALAERAQKLEGKTRNNGDADELTELDLSISTITAEIPELTPASPQSKLQPIQDELQNLEKRLNALEMRCAPH